MTKARRIISFSLLSIITRDDKRRRIVVIVSSMAKIRLFSVYFLALLILDKPFIIQIYK